MAAEIYRQGEFGREVKKCDLKMTGPVNQSGSGVELDDALDFEGSVRCRPNCPSCEREHRWPMLCCTYKLSKMLKMPLPAHV
jgi:hypothetical protein